MILTGYGFSVTFDVKPLTALVCKVYSGSLAGKCDMERAMAFQVLSAIPQKLCKGLRLYVASNNTMDEVSVVVEYDKFKCAKAAFSHVSGDDGIKLFLHDTRPYMQKNRLRDSGLDYALIGKGDTETGKFCPAAAFNTRFAPAGYAPHKVILAPDSFKGSLTSKECILLLAVAARYDYIGAKLTPLATADGGEGTLEAFDAACKKNKPEYVSVPCHDPLGREIQAQYLRINESTAVVEMALASGLTLVDEADRNIVISSSYGTGELIAAAIRDGAQRVIIGLGGSATNDAGMGIARALGVRFFDENDDELIGIADDMAHVRRIDPANAKAFIDDVELICMCDVTNPFVGLNGATMVFSPQKGADERTMFALECGMKNLRHVIYDTVKIDITNALGAGAAGGAGGMLYSLFNAKICSGIESLLDEVNIDRELKNTALMVTGEGKLDAQTLMGHKAVCGVIDACVPRNVPVGIVAGALGDDLDINDTRLSSCTVVTLTHSGIDVEESVARAGELFFQAALRLFRGVWSSRRLHVYESVLAVQVKLILKKAAALLLKGLKLGVKYFFICIGFILGLLWKWLCVVLPFIWKYVKTGVVWLAKSLWKELKIFVPWLGKQVVMLCKKCVSAVKLACKKYRAAKEAKKADASAKNNHSESE